jgi:cellulose synthase/poly-beta-1,6-N-acetylglucosamine synthase-like glycosyltransferase
MISVLLASLSALLAFPVAILVMEVIAALAVQNRNYATLSKQHSQRVAVLVPAHNESCGLLATITDVKLQLGQRDRLLVVADNCSDDTAAVAAAAGAEVIERRDSDRRGKGYALARGIEHLSLDPPDVVIVIDADCRVADDVLEDLASSCASTNRPVQAPYLMNAPDDAPINTKVAQFAWYLKNYIRPRGLRNLGLPCQLMGSGMAFPWNVIRAADVATGSIVEDLKLGLDLTLAGHPPVFCPFPCVVSEFPHTLKALQSQRQRWEQGHISMILTAWPHLISISIARRDLNLLALALDLAVPPLSVLGTLILGTLALGELASLFGLSSTARLISSIDLLALVSAVFTSWLRFGRTILQPRSIGLIVPYLFRKLILYSSIIFGKRGPRWTRTDRRII